MMIISNRFLFNYLRNNLFYRYLSTQKNDYLEKYEPVIGLEIHAQLQTDSKLFSPASTCFHSRPNSQATFFDVSLPGTLPVLNRKCVEMAVKAGLGLNCHISTKSTFDRKHYFYGDMPNGYQITQQNNPIAYDGYIEFVVSNDDYTIDDSFQPYLKRCRLKQIQLEQDSGKSLEDSELNVNLIDLNRAGAPLIELVFEPDLRSSLEIVCLVKELIMILKSIEICSCKMEEGALRVDANISIRPRGSQDLGQRTEIKNLNSFRFLREASNYEIERQCLILEQNGSIKNETLGYDFRSKQTFVMRDKEIVQDYRFMPEPNLPPIIFAEHNLKKNFNLCSNQSLISINKIKEQMPELPKQTRQKLLSEYHLSLREIFLLNDFVRLQLFYEIFELTKRKVGSECFYFIYKYLKPIFEDKMDPLTLLKIAPMNKSMSLATIGDYVDTTNLAEMCDMLFGGEISENTVNDLLKLYLQRDKRNARNIIEEYNWWLITDLEKIEKVCQQVIEQIPKIARKYSKTGVRKPKSMLIQNACILLNNQVNENILWDVYDKILRNK